MSTIKPPPNKPDKLPRERLSLPLTPHLTKAVQAVAKAYGRPQAQVLAGLMELAAPVLAAKLEALRDTYEETQRQALADVLGRPAEMAKDQLARTTVPALDGSAVPAWRTAEGHVFVDPDAAKAEED